MRKVLLFLVLVLSISFVLSASYSSESGVSIVTQSGYSCVKDDTSAYWTRVGENITIFPNVTAGSVFGKCNLSADWCCPNNYYCDDGHCVSNGTLDMCFSFDEDSCEGAGEEYAVAYIESLGENYTGVCSASNYFLGMDGYNCVNASSCECAWDEENDVCVSELDLFGLCAGGISTYNNSCYWSEGSKEDKCESSGVLIVNYIVSGNGVGKNALCVNQTKTYPCSVSVKVPFFDYKNFLISFLAVCFIYFVFRRNFDEK